NAPTQVVIKGAETSLEGAEPVVLTARAYGIGNFDRSLSWRILEGDGTLEPNGDTAIFTPEPELTSDQTVVIQVGTGSGASWQTSFKIFPPDSLAIPMRQGNGPNDFRFPPLDRAIMDFMRARCVGAAVVAVSRYGNEIYRAGYGRRDGAPVNDQQWLERCPSDDFGVGAPGTHPSTPFYIGSNNKSMTAARAWEAARRRYVDVHGSQPSEAQLVGMNLCDADYDLLPARLRQVLCGEVPLPVEPYVSDPLPPPQIGFAALATGCDEVTCNNGGWCTEVFAGYVSGQNLPLIQPMCICPSGFSG